jgi:transposase InsO family protein
LIILKKAIDVVTDALMTAIWRSGSQYTSERFQRLIADHGVVCSMSRSAILTDDGVALIPINERYRQETDVRNCKATLR